MWYVALMLIALVVSHKEVSDSDICIVLAIIYHESLFDPHAKNPGSTAKGYPQALDATWRDYQKVRGVHRRRDHIGDSIDFVRWYNEKSRALLGVSLPEDFYLAYHYGWTGYRRGIFSKHVLRTAGKVRETALTKCLYISKIAFRRVAEDM